MNAALGPFSRRATWCPFGRERTVDPIDAFAVIGSGVALVLGVLAGAAGVAPSVQVGPHLWGTWREASSIALNNVTLCASIIGLAHVPLLGRRWSRHVIDVAAVALLAPASFVVGLVATEPGGLPHLPHAPLELWAVALATSWWWRHRDSPPPPSATLGRLVIVSTALIFAALTETFGVPHLP